MLFVGNYDYIWDFVLYLNGAFEGRVYVTGYVNIVFLSGGEESFFFGNCVGERVLGVVYTYVFYFKLDLDVVGECLWDED